MSVLVFTETWNGKFKKSSYEAVAYASELAQLLNTSTTALVIGCDNCEDNLAKYGANKIISTNAKYNNHAFASIIEKITKEEDPSCIVLSQTVNGKSILPLLAIKTNASVISNVVELPSSTSPFIVKKKVFSNKAFENLQFNGDLKLIAIIPNSVGVRENPQSAKIQKIDISIDNKDYKTQSLNIDKAAGKVSLADAEIVVSAGRGLKGPENWKMIENLADILGAATACSKPVSDVGWRPHSEHVGQTGITISSDLYIAIGISGAIQHLAGVSSSKVMVAINIDAEAPFFKAADYGIIGDAFDVIPKLNQALKKFKN